MEADRIRGQLLLLCGAQAPFSQIARRCYVRALYPTTCACPREVAAQLRKTDSACGSMLRVLGKILKACHRRRAWNEPSVWDRLTLQSTCGQADPPHRLLTQITGPWAHLARVDARLATQQAEPERMTRCAASLTPRRIRLWLDTRLGRPSQTASSARMKQKRRHMNCGAAVFAPRSSLYCTLTVTSSRYI